jgi:Phage integrase family
MIWCSPPDVAAQSRAATLLIEEGVHIRVVQEVLGHTRATTTERYTHMVTRAASWSPVRWMDPGGQRVPRQGGDAADGHERLEPGLGGGAADPPGWRSAPAKRAGAAESATQTALGSISASARRYAAADRRTASACASRSGFGQQLAKYAHRDPAR